MNKKGNLMRVMFSILVLGFFIFLFLFFTVGFKQIFSENIIAPVLNSTLTATSDGLTAETINTVNSFKTQYDEPFFNYDLFFLVIILVFSGGVITQSYTTRKLGIFSFFGMLTVGSWIFLLMLGFMKQVSDWLILNLYTNLFDLTLINTPIITWFLTNISFYSFGLFLICVLVNQVDFQQVLRRETEGEREE